MKVKAIRFHKPGNASVLKWDDVELGKPKSGEALVRHTAIGLNYIDTYHRTGLYPLPMPSGVGLEGAGVVEAIGRGVTHLKVGDRVAYAGGPIGAYAEARVMPADKLVKIPNGISDEQAAAMMLKGMTVLFHAAAGGVGLIAGQWLKALGATAIGTAGSPAKMKLAKAHGYAHVVDYKKQDFVKSVMRLTKKAGVPVVYDSVGKSTFMGSLDCLQPRGTMVSFGNASGAVDPFPPGLLAQKGSLFLTRPTLMDYTATRKDLEASARALFSVVRSGKVKIEVNQTYKLKDAAKAHRDLQGRKTTGSTLLIP